MIYSQPYHMYVPIMKQCLNVTGYFILQKSDCVTLRLRPTSG